MDVNERLLNSDTPLMMAARTGNVATMALLLERGADVNAAGTTRGTTALMWAAAQGHAGPSSSCGARRGCQGRVEPAWQDRPISYAKAVDPRPSRKRDANNVVSQIGPRNMRDQRGGGLTPLVLAVRANDLASVKILLDAGADVNQVTN